MWTIKPLQKTQSVGCKKELKKVFTQQNYNHKKSICYCFNFPNNEASYSFLDFQAYKRFKSQFPMQVVNTLIDQACWNEAKMASHQSAEYTKHTCQCYKQG